MSFEPGDDHGLAVDEDGPADGSVVVLVHGSMDRAAGFAKVARRLADTYRVIRYDRRGYGRSNPHQGPFTIADNVTDLARLVGDRDVVLVGHSLGGNIALAAAERIGGRVRAVAIYESPLSWTSWWPRTSAGVGALASSNDPAEVAEGFMTRMVGVERWRRLPAATRAARRSEGPALIGEITSLQAGRPWDPAAIGVPVAVGRGSEGREHHQRGTEMVAGWLPGAQLVTLVGCGHLAHVTHPDLLTDELIRPLLERVGW